MGNQCATGAAAGRGSGETRRLEAYEDPMQKAMAMAGQDLRKNKGKKLGDIYTVPTRLLGQGAYSKVVEVARKGSAERFAVKSIDKSLLDGREGILKEIAAMRLLESHPNCVKLYEVYEDATQYHLVLELCSGGQLFERIIAKGHLGEREAAASMRSILDFVAFAHSKNITHRDLKPENILLSDKSERAVIKVIDFGSSDFCADGQRLTQKIGTPFYVAPEVLCEDYGKSADIWSAGVIMFVILCGHLPFGGKGDDAVMKQVLAGEYAFDRAEWSEVTEAAKEFIGCMLQKDAAKRATAGQLLQHPWFQAAAAVAPQ